MTAKPVPTQTCRPPHNSYLEKRERGREKERERESDCPGGTPCSQQQAAWGSICGPDEKKIETSEKNSLDSVTHQNDEQSILKFLVACLDVLDAWRRGGGC